MSSMDLDRLELVRGFVNTVDTETGVDDLDIAGRAWRSGCPDATCCRAARRRRLRISPGRCALREALRDLLLENAGGSPAPAALETLDRQAQRSRITLRFDRAGGTLEPQATGVDAVPRPHPGRRSPPRWPTGRGAGSRRAVPTTAAGPSSTARGTARGTGATCVSAATARRHEPSGRATAVTHLGETGSASRAARSWWRRAGSWPTASSTSRSSSAARRIAMRSATGVAASSSTSGPRCAAEPLAHARRRSASRASSIEFSTIPISTFSTMNAATRMKLTK